MTACLPAESLAAATGASPTASWSQDDGERLPIRAVLAAVVARMALNRDGTAPRATEEWRPTRAFARRLVRSSGNALVRLQSERSQVSSVLTSAALELAL